MDIFGKKISVEFLKILVQESSQLNHASVFGTPFSSCQAPPATRDRRLGMRIGIARDGFESYPVYGERAFFFTVPRQRQADQQLIL